MPWSPDKIPVWLRRTPEQQQRDQQYQDTLRQAQGPGRRPNPTEQHLLRAAAVRRSATAQLEHLRRDPEADPAQVTTAAAQLAEAMATEGDFAEAAEIHPNPELAERFQKIATAVERDDGEGCDCPVVQETDPATGQPITLSLTRIEEMVISRKHGNRLMPLVVCACGDMNVRPAPQQQEERLRRVRQEHTQAKEAQNENAISRRP